MNLHRLRCQCGRLAGTVSTARPAVRMSCYCRDCRAYAVHLGQEREVLDAQGGTDIVATHADAVRITSGADQLACLALTPQGLYRWFARCCGSPIANTPRDSKLPYVGLVHSALEAPLAPDFPDEHLRINTQSARGTVAPTNARAALAAMRLMPGLLWRRVRGDSRPTPFFTEAGLPVAPVQVLSEGERAKAMAAN